MSGAGTAATPPTRPPRGEAFWLRSLFSCATHRPWVLRVMRPIVKIGVPIYAPRVRQAVAKNTARLLGRPQPGLAREVVASFYDFIADLSTASHASADELRQRIGSVDGHEAFLALRKQGRGAVMVTAHMGSFEVGLAALAEFEKEIHVVFKRDANDHFEALRQKVRHMLGIHEAAIDDGWPTLFRLRDRLDAGAVVVMQADRAMPGQKAQVVPFARGHVRLPLGPLRLAQMTGSPIVPVFTVRRPDGKFHISIEPPIDAASDDALPQLAAVLARFIAAHPEQWLVLEPAFVEDAAS